MRTSLFPKGNLYFKVKKVIKFIYNLKAGSVALAFAWESIFAKKISVQHWDFGNIQEIKSSRRPL